MSDLLDAVHKTVKGLYDAGVMDATIMHEFDALCLPQVKELSSGQIKRLRLKCKASQPVFAAFLDVSLSMVQKWESGQKRPNGPSLKLLNLVKNKGLKYWAEYRCPKPAMDIHLWRVFFVKRLTGWGTLTLI